MGVTGVVGKHLADVGCAGSVCHQILEVLYCQTNSPGLPGHGDDEVAAYLVGILGLLYHVGIYGVGGHLYHHAVIVARLVLLAIGDGLAR